MSYDNKLVNRLLKIFVVNFGKVQSKDMAAVQNLYLSSI